MMKKKKKKKNFKCHFLNTGGYTKTQNQNRFGKDKKTIENEEFCRVLTKYEMEQECKT